MLGSGHLVLGAGSGCWALGAGSWMLGAGLWPMCTMWEGISVERILGLVQREGQQVQSTWGVSSLSGEEREAPWPSWGGPKWAWEHSHSDGI